MLLDDIDRRLVDDWQRDFPISPEPFAEIAATLDVDEAETLARLRRLQSSGALSRVGAVVRPNTVGASTLAALAVAPERLEQVAAAVVAEPGVNHAYEREHDFNLWFVVTAPDAAGVDAAIARIETRTGERVLVLPMLRDFHIDLGFRLFSTGSRARAKKSTVAREIVEQDRRLLGAIEDGIELAPRPFLHVARQLGWSETAVLGRLEALIDAGVIARFGLVLRHRHFGYSSNAMVVWDLPDDRLEETAQAFAERDFVTLCYERPRRVGLWRYNLFTMIHGRERTAALAHVDELARMTPHVRDRHVLFSRRCFRQRGARLSAA